MNADLSLEEAALHLGIPSEVLHSWAWAKTGPKSNGAYWKPRFALSDLNAWKREQGAQMNAAVR